MADIQRLQGNSLIESLIGTKCCGFDFFRAVRLMQMEGLKRGQPMIGASRTPSDDPIRFAQRPSLRFAPSTLDEMMPNPAGAEYPPKLYVNFMGLFGPNGPLPLHVTEYAIRQALGQFTTGGASGFRPEPAPEERGRKNPGFAAFFDIFHHRFISLFFRAWAAAQPTVDLDRPDHHRFLFFLGAFSGESNAGIGETRDEGGNVVSLMQKAYYMGHLASGSRNAEGLRAILRDYFNVPAVVREFVGKWLNLPEEDLCRLGHKRASALGCTAIVGRRMWAINLAFRIRLGPMGWDRYLSFLPGARNSKMLVAWVGQYCGAELLWDVELVLLAKEAPATCLGRVSDAEGRPFGGRLGWTTWLKSKNLAADAEVVPGMAPGWN